MNYEDFCHIASICSEQIGAKCRRFFSPSNFMKFEKDEYGRVAILPFYLYVMRTVSLAYLHIHHRYFCSPAHLLLTQASGIDSDFSDSDLLLSTGFIDTSPNRHE